MSSHIVTGESHIVTGESHLPAEKMPLFHARIALDGTPHSEALLNGIHRYLQPKHAACSLLTVVPNTADKDPNFEAFDAESQAEVAIVVEQQFNQYADILATQNVALDGRQVVFNVDSVETAVIQNIKDDAPDMLIMGMHDDVDTKRDAGWRVNATSYSIATHVPCSVMVIKNPVQNEQMLRVFFATDGSSHAENAAERLRGFLPRENTIITIFAAVSVNTYTLPLVEPYIDYTPLEHALKGQAKTLMEESKNQFERAGFKVDAAYFGLGDPVELILEESIRQQSNLIVLGSHGIRGSLSRWLLGSVSSKVLQYAPTSVAVLR